jgi:hypothetical protein
MQTDPLARAYELTQTMAVAIEAGDWQFASSLAEERSPLLMALAPAQSDAALATIRAIQAIDERIMGRAADARGEMETSHVDAQKRIAAASFYQSTGQLR